MRLFLAPMEGLVDDLIRDQLTEIGGIDRCVTEFVRVTQGLLPPRVFYRFAPELKNESRTGAGIPVAVQLLGSNPEQMAINAARAVELGAPRIDLNFGCPAKTVNKHRGGAVLLDEPALIEALVTAVRKAVPESVPVTAKIRLGFGDRSMGLACGEAAESGGAAELCVHARSKVDGYRPPAYWESIRPIRERLQIPVIANGDIWTVADYWRCREVTGCDDVMIGRGLISRPDLARRIRASQQGDELEPMTWAGVVGEIAAYGERLRQSLDDPYVVGRLKQWLNYTRRAYAEAEQGWRDLKRLKDYDGFVGSLRASAGQTSAGQSSNDPRPASPVPGTRSDRDFRYSAPAPS